MTKGAGSLTVIGDAGAAHAMRCGECGPLLYWTVRDGARADGAHLRRLEGSTA